MGTEPKGRKRGHISTVRKDIYRLVREEFSSNLSIERDVFVLKNCCESNMEHLPKKIHHSIGYADGRLHTDLKLEEKRPIRRWGRMHKAFLQNTAPASELLCRENSGRLLLT